MKKIFLLTIGILLIINNLKSQDMSFYTTKWKEVDNYLAQQRPKSALNIIDQIYQQAQKDNLQEQLLKCDIYYAKAYSLYKESAFEDFIYTLENDLYTAPFPNKALIHSMLGELYWKYYQDHKWDISDRTQTHIRPMDIKLWSAKDFIEKSIEHFNASVQEPDKLKNYSINFYKELIIKGNKAEWFPTLFDFLAYRNIKFLSSPEASISRPKDYFQINDSIYYSDTKTFANSKIRSNDTLSLHYNGILLLQKWLRYRLQDTSNIEALIFVEIQRIDFVNNFSVLYNKNELYIKFLNYLLKEYPPNELTPYIKLKLAKIYNDLGRKFNPRDSTTKKFQNKYILAEKICKEIISSSKDTNIVNQAKNLLSQINIKSLKVKNESIIPAHQKFAVQLIYLNIEKIYVEIYSLKDNAEYQKITNNYGKKLLEALKLKQPIKQYEFNLINQKDKQPHITEIIIDSLPLGKYLIFISDKKDKSSQQVYAYTDIDISNLSLITEKLNDGSYICQVINRTNNEPVVNASITATYTIYNSKKNKYISKTYKKYTTDKNGRFLVKSSKIGRDLDFTISYGKDSLTVHNAVYLSDYNNYRKTEPYQKIKIYTDRGIYRPGQIVYFKGLMIDYNNEDHPKILSNQKVEVSFLDANYQKVSSQTFITNKFGSFQGNFHIPQGVLTGTMYLETKWGTKTIQVEEYKRPTFKVQILEPQEQHIVNQVVKIEGKAENYSGVKITDGIVQYQVKRYKRKFIWRWWNIDYDQEEVIITQGYTKTDKNGRFTIDFLAVPDLTEPESPETYFDFQIDVVVSDINGETQSASKTVSIGYTAFTINTNLPEIIEKHQFNEGLDSIKITALTPNYQKVNTNGQIELWTLQTPKTALKNRYWHYPDLPLYTQKQWYELYPGNEYTNESDYHNWKENNKIWTTEFDTQKDEAVNIQDFKDLKPGVYKLKIISKDKFGKKIEISQYFVIYDQTTQTLPYPTDNWIHLQKQKLEPGDTAIFSIGSYSPTKITMQIILNDEIIETKSFDLKNNKTLVKIPVKEEYRGNFKVLFIHIARNRIFNEEYVIKVPYTNKQLNIEFLTFRDKLQPGEQEKWKIIVKDKNADPQLAEMLTTMYDASLDAFVPNKWDVSFYKTNSLDIHWTTHYFDAQDWYENSVYQIPSYLYNEWIYPEFCWCGLNFYQYSYRNFSRSIRKSKRLSSEPETMAMEDEASAPIQSKEITTEKKPIIRKNFSETAFFYPQLETNKDGELVISFKMPESLTEWHFMAFAHTQDLKYGFIQKFISTQKELSVMPNAPRFFRQGDTLFFTAKISNLTNKPLKGTAVLEFYDQITDKKVNILTSGQKEEQQFLVDKKGNTVLKWKIAIDENSQILTYKIVAKADKFSDGEQKAIPVLTNKILVTEALPLAVGPKQTKNFKLKKLINSEKSETLKNYRLTVEYTSNPAWYAVEALPYLIEYPYECNEQTFSRIYANSLAAYIMNSSPRIKEVFDTWKDYQPTALNSNLEKNQKLKNIILTETPWIAEAKSQTQQLHNLAILFNLNKINNQNKEAIAKLEKQQKSNGAWGWFAGMKGNWYITQYIAQGIGHLNKLNVIQQQDKLFELGTKAIKFTDEKMMEHYQELTKIYTKRQLKNYHPYSLIIHYFYTRTFYSIPLNDKYKKAYDYFYNQLKKYWIDYSLYEQGMLSLIFYRNNDKNLANSIILSLKERALYDDELGMYWRDNTSGYYWYKNAIQTQAMMIEAFYEIAKDTQSVDQLKIWLLKNKQTNHWQTTIATAEAVYSLLLTGEKNLLQNNQIGTIKLGDTLIDPENNPQITTQAGTGYYKISFENGEIKPQMGNITVENKNDIINWGALYWQYFENIDKITPNQTPLHIQKKLYRKITTNSGEQLIPINDKESIKIGDKIVVRLEIKTDRDMEYVHLKDMRAAGFEPVDVISQYKNQSGIGYYQTTKDASTNFFFDYLPKGTYVLEYSLRATVSGSFSNGISTLQCMYAPEFSSHTKGLRVNIK